MRTVRQQRQEELADMAQTAQDSGDYAEASRLYYKAAVATLDDAYARRNKYTELARENLQRLTGEV